MSLSTDTSTIQKPGTVPWGDETVSLNFPGGPYSLSGLSDAQAADLRDRFSNYCIQADAGRRVMQVSVTRGPDSQQTQEILASGEYTLDITYDKHSIQAQGLRFIGSADYDPMTTAMIATPGNEGGTTWSIFENFLRLLVAHRLLDTNGLILHSAAIVIDGGAYLFYGVSDAGKSTLSEMASKAGYEVISDDLNAVEFFANRAQVRKLPFTGTFSGTTCRQESYPLRGVFKLEQARHNSVRQPGVAESLASLLACAPYVNTSAVLLEQLQNRLLQFFDCVSPSVLSFSNVGDFNEIATLLESTNA